MRSGRRAVSLWPRDRARCATHTAAIETALALAVKPEARMGDLDDEHKTHLVLSD